MSVAQAKEEIEKELTCPLCLGIFEDPKKLPCDHIYCKEPCLQGLLQCSQINGSITCPECRTVVQVPHNDVKDLPTAFRINRLKQIYEGISKDATASSFSSSTSKCQVHETQQLAIYCETCEKVLCRDCVLMSNDHKEHAYGYIEKEAKKQRQLLKELVEPKRKQQEILSISLLKANEIKTKFLAESEDRQTKIRESFDSLLEVLQREKDALLQHNAELSEEKLATIDKHRMNTFENIGELSEAIVTAENACQNHTDIQLLTQKKHLVHQLQLSGQKSHHYSVLAPEPETVVVDVVSPETLHKLCKEECMLHTLADPKLCQAEGQGLEQAELHSPAMVTLHLVDFQGADCVGKQNVSVRLQPKRRNQTVITIGECKGPLTPGCYQVLYTPTTRGRHELSIKVNDVHIRGSPFQVFVQIHPSQLLSPQGVVSGEFQRPTGLATFNDMILAVEHDKNRIVAIDSELNVVAVLVSDRFLNGPSGVATDTNYNIYTCTINNHKIHKFLKDGSHVKSIGKLGKKSREFNFPNGNGVNTFKDNNLYICDSENHRIQVYDAELNFKHAFGSKGTGKGNFQFPSDVHFDEAGNIYIVDSRNHRIQIFTPERRFLRVVGKHGSGPGELNEPIGIQVKSGLIYVTECDRISVFTTDGNFVTTFGENYLSRPEGMEIDDDGFIYVSSHKNKVIVF